MQMNDEQIEKFARIYLETNGKISDVALQIFVAHSPNGENVSLDKIQKTLLKLYDAEELDVIYMSATTYLFKKAVKKSNGRWSYARQVSR
jgi:hypothetical protein